MNAAKGFPTTRTAVAQLQGYANPATGSIVPAIDLSTTYERDASYSLLGGRLYSRADNPGYEHVENLITELEHGAASAVFSSGMAAATTVFATLKTGDHVLVSEVLYWALRSWMLEWAGSWGIDLQLVDSTSVNIVRAALRPGVTKLLWIETPANPTLAITDIAAMAELAHRVQAIVAVDSTFATPLFQTPLMLGADLVMHSATKYLERPFRCDRRHPYDANQGRLVGPGDSPSFPDRKRPGTGGNLAVATRYADALCAGRGPDSLRPGDCGTL